MLTFGIVVLLAGVWVVSLMPGPPETDMFEDSQEGPIELTNEPEDLLEEYDWEAGRPAPPLRRFQLDAVKRMLLEEAPRGFRIGLAASSPGMEQFHETLAKKNPTS